MGEWIIYCLEGNWEFFYVTYPLIPLFPYSPFPLPSFYLAYPSFTIFLLSTVFGKESILFN